MVQRYLLLLTLGLLFGCIGTDVLDDPEILDPTGMDPMEMDTLANDRVAEFSGTSGYVGEGTVTLSQQDQLIILELADNFRTSFALGTFVYLSNSTGGAETRGSGLELGEISENGAHTFNVTQIANALNETVTLNQYRYCIILCKPASISFAIADFEE